MSWSDMLSSDLRFDNRRVPQPSSGTVMDAKAKADYQKAAVSNQHSAIS